MARSRVTAVAAYRMDKRAQDVAATRQDIVEAAVRLHGSVGPAATTVSAVAQEAGVTRLTVYRHFPDAEALFAACSAHWGSGQRTRTSRRWLQVSTRASDCASGWPTCTGSMPRVRRC